MIKDPVILLVMAYKGMTRKELYDIYTPGREKEYRRKGAEEWITFNNCVTKETGTEITFYLVDGKIMKWDF